jgi:hypothetical protein
MPRKLGFVLVTVGLVSFLVSISAFFFPPNPSWWVATMAGGLLCVGWGTVLLLPRKFARWGVAYMVPMSVLVPLMTVWLNHAPN